MLSQARGLMSGSLRCVSHLHYYMQLHLHYALELTRRMCITRGIERSMLAFLVTTRKWKERHLCHVLVEV